MQRQWRFWFKHSKILIPIYVWVALNLIWTNFPRYVLIYLSIIDYEICSKIPHYFFIWPYLFKWHLRVALYKESSYLRRFRLYYLTFLVLLVLTRFILDSYWTLHSSFVDLKPTFDIIKNCDKDLLFQVCIQVHSSCKKV